MRTTERVTLFTLGRVESDRVPLHNQDQLIVLLAYLALNGVTSRADLAQLFWPQSANPLNSLSSALTRLRKAVPDCVNATTKTVSANVEFDGLLLTHAAEDENHERVSELYVGEFLRGFKLKSLGITLEDWIYTQREAFAELALRSAIGWFRSDPAQRPRAAQLADRALVTCGVAVLEVPERDALYVLLESTNSPRVAGLLSEAPELESGRASIVRQPRPLYVPPPGALVGRDADLARLEAACEPGRVVHISGDDGVGKTALLRAFASRSAQDARFGGGITVLTIGDQVPGTVLSERIAEALALPGDPNESLATRISCAIRGPRLLVLDDVASSRSVNELLATMHGGPLGVVSSGRDPMGSELIHDIAIDGLGTESENRCSWPDAATLLYRCFDEAGLIFDDRHTPAEMCMLAQQAAGNPLAIELIASVSARLDTISGSSLIIDEDHGTCVLTCLLEKMWALLREDERRAMTVISAFSATFGRDVAQLVARVDVGTLASLHRLGLIRTDSERVMRLHPAVRSFVQGRLLGDDTGSNPIASTMFKLLTEWDPTNERKGGGCRTPTKLAIYHADLENVWEAAVDDRNWDTLARAVGPYVRYLVPARAVSAYRVLRETRDVLAAEDSAIRTRYRALHNELTRGVAWAALELHQNEHAQACLTELLDDPDASAFAVLDGAWLQARILARSGDWELALSVVDTALDHPTRGSTLCETASVLEARLHIERGRVLRHLGQSESALGAFRKALDAARPRLAADIEAQIYAELAVTTATRDVAHALVLVDEGLRVCAHVDDPKAELSLLGQKALLLYRIDNRDAAQRLASDLYERSIGANDYRTTALVLMLKGVLGSDDAGSEDAMELVCRGWAIARCCYDPAELSEIAASLSLERFSPDLAAT